jgi:N-acetylglucosaminyldiphosphoundecaprenol N-acetyl-beta-D-mannosaminyltransferase
MPRVPVITTGIDTTSLSEACHTIYQWSQESQRSRYVVASNVHVVMTAYGDWQYQQVLAEADLVIPDGMPLVFALRLLGYKSQTRVAGPDLMWQFCRDYSHVPIFLYGSDPQTLEALTARLKQHFPQLAIAGSYAPPLWQREREPTYPHLQADLELIAQSSARVVFVALGCPKQELWMHQAVAVCPRPLVFVGVGAAFAIHSGRVRRAPRWMQAIALEWLFRLLQEPRRLWRRYLVYNPLFLLLFTAQLLQRLFAKPRSVER